jgi:predicted nuclease of predicted toxin-antitoxin system
MQFLIDENLPPEIGQMLHAEGHTAVDVADSPLRGYKDQELWQLAAEHGMVVVSRDLDFPLRDRMAPPALILLRPGKADNKTAILEMFRGFIANGGLANLDGTVVVLSPGREPRVSLLA